jgi:hypothetical protein
MADIRITEEQLATLLTNAVKAAVAAQAPAEGARATMTSEERFHAQVDEVRTVPGPAIRVDMVEGCVSHVTGSTFSAEIQHGRVVNLLDYRHPAGIDKHENEGGVIPNGFPILKTDGQPTKEYKQHVWETYLQTDLRTFVGKPLPGYVKAPARMADVVKAKE